MNDLPVQKLAAAFRQSFTAGPVVLSAPTGSGKSTLVPGWCAELAGSALVVQPRRVACRSLARHVARLAGTALGEKVGYAVRHDEQLSPGTRILFVTPGIALRMLEGERHRRFGAVVLDEFHERGLETDLLLGLLRSEPALRLVVMSATLDGERVARFLGGTHLAAQGRTFPVTVEYAGDPLLPSERGLEERVAQAVERMADRPGDMLVFLPGRAEIAACQAALRHRRELEVVPLHGQLPPEEQDRAFEPGPRRRVILATNVAETSITLPRIGVVIDSGLVRQTRYRETRGYLTLMPIALDSAEQRRGRAGRLAPGHCLRLWSEAALLEPSTQPEIQREALPVAVLAAAACGRRLRELALLDPPRPYACESAEQSLRAMGALDDDLRLTKLGRRLWALPLDAHLGRILLEAEQDGSPQAAAVLQAAVDLVAAVASGRPLFLSGPRPADPEDDLRAAGCDATALVAALRRGQPGQHRLAAAALAEARRIAAQLRGQLRLPSPVAGPARSGTPDLSPAEREALARVVLRAHRHAAYIPRRRKRAVAWANGREELELGQESAIREDTAEALAVIDTRALTVKRRQAVQVITCAIPCSAATLRAAGLGEVRVGQARLVAGGRVVAEAIRSYAGLVLERDEEVPRGERAREAVVRLALTGELFPEALAVTRERLAAHNLYQRLRGSGERIELEAWLGGQVARVGLDSGDDLPLLLPADLTFPDLPAEERAWLDRSFPRELSLGDARYEVSYDEQRQEVTLVKVGGTRSTLPSEAYLPAWPGWRVLHRDRNVLRVLRERR